MGFGGPKKRKHTKFGVLYFRVDSTDIFSNSYKEDLKLLLNILDDIKP